MDSSHSLGAYQQLQLRNRILASAEAHLRQQLHLCINDDWQNWVEYVFKKAIQEAGSPGTADLVPVFAALEKETVFRGFPNLYTYAAHPGRTGEEICEVLSKARQHPLHKGEDLPE